jgi:hypothetical protein
MFGTKVVPAIARTLVALTLATGLAAGATKPAEASTMTDAYMACAEGTGGIYFGLPLSGGARMSLFAFRVDSGSWQFTNWYYTSNGSYWMWEGKWVSLPFDSSMTARNIGGNHNVYGYEYRYNPSTASGGWVNLGSCRTSSFYESGIIIN